MTDSSAFRPPRERELIVVVGPTASGKTDLAIALAEELGGEIIGADSVQVYRRFDIGSAKPTAAERARAPHHVIDCIDPLEPMDAGRFVSMADEAIASIRARGRLPIVCGGTFLWVKALVQGLASLPKDDAIRAKHQAIAEAEGRARLHAMLAEVDPASAAKLAPNDLVRTSRALEVFELSGKPMSVLHAEHQFGDARYEPRFVGVRREKDELDRRIEARVARCLAQGFVDEVSGLIADGYRQARGLGSVGYREIVAHLEGQLPAVELAPAIVRSTRVFVRRQRTWIRDLAIEWTKPNT